MRTDLRTEDREAHMLINYLIVAAVVGVMAGIFISPI